MILYVWFLFYWVMINWCKELLMKLWSFVMKVWWNWKKSDYAFELIDIIESGRHKRFTQALWIIDLGLISLDLIMIRMLISIIPFILVIIQNRGLSRSFFQCQIHRFIFYDIKSYSTSNSSEIHCSSCILSWYSFALCYQGKVQALWTSLG